MISIEPASGPHQESRDTASDPPVAPPLRGREPRARRLAIPIIIVALLATGGVLVLRHGAPALQAAAEVPGPEGGPVVAVVPVRRATIAQEETFSGEFRPYNRVVLHAKVAGFLRSIAVDIGDQVRAGQVLGELEIPDLDNDIARARAQVQRGGAEVARQQSAYDQAHQVAQRIAAVGKGHPNLIAQQDLDVAGDQDRAAAAALDSARFQVQVAQAELDKLLADQDYCKIRAPFSGVITQRSADPGTLVQGGTSPSAQATPLLTLAQNDLLRLVFPVAEAYVARIAVDAPIHVAIPALGRDGDARIKRFSRHVVDATRTMQVEAELPNADLAITPGMYGVVRLAIDRHDQALCVPTAAVARAKNSASVYVVGADGRIEERA